METTMPSRPTDTARLLISRLERLSADSLYAHRASGLRGSLLRYLEQAESGDQYGLKGSFSPSQIDNILSLGFQILEKAAKEVRPPRRWDKNDPGR
jgi:hypothetical protein